MTEDKEDRILTIMIMVPITLMLLLAIYEGILVSIAFIHADEIECNFLWCEFTTISDTIEKNMTISITMTQQCFLNGHQVNCSLIGATT